MHKDNFENNKHLKIQKALNTKNLHSLLFERNQRKVKDLKTSNSWQEKR